MTALLNTIAMLISLISVPPVADVEYRYYESGSHIVELQEWLGNVQVDGVYGPNTRKAHMKSLGSKEMAYHRWYGGGKMGEPERLDVLVREYFLPEHQAWAMRVAFCESSTQPWHTSNYAISPALAVGVFQHLSKYWDSRSASAGWDGYSPYDIRANTATAAHLFYSSGKHHWNPSRSCWEEDILQ